MRKLHASKAFVLLSLLLTFFCGCGDSGSGFYPVTPVGRPANIEVNHVSARAVPSSIDQLRFTGADISGNVTYGPETRNYEEKITLRDVPLATRGFLIEYLSDGEVVGRFTTTVDLQPGETYVINNPAWVDVGNFGAAAQLKFLVPPVDGTAGVPLSPPVRVVVLDADGMLVENSTLAVTLTLDGDGTVRGTTTVNAVDGIATFNNPVFTPGSGYTLTASAQGVAPVTSSPFNMLGAVARGEYSVVLPGPATGSPATSASADFDKDGRADIAFGGSQVDSETKSLVVYFQNEKGDYDPVVLSNDINVAFVSTGDFNGDGDADIAVFISGETNAVQVWEGNGGRTFSAQDAVTTTANGTAFESADVTGDGIDDVLVLSGQAVSAPPETGPLVSSGEPSISIIAEPTEFLEVYVGGAEGLSGPSTRTLGSSPTDFAIGQLVGDEKVDLAVTDGSSVKIYQGNGDGTFGSETASITLDDPGVAIVLGDFDLQYGLDVAVVVSGDSYGFFTDGNLWVYLQNDVGGFDPAPGTGANYGDLLPVNSIVPQPLSRILAAGDVNGDGATDLGFVATFHVTSEIFPTLELHLSDPDSVSVFSSPISTRTGDLGRELSFNELNGDGRLDALVATEDDSVLRLNGTGDGHFLPSSSRGDESLVAVSGDLNNDQLDDLVILTVDNTVDIYVRQPDGSLPAAPNSSTKFEGSLGAQAYIVDVDGDKKRDLVVGGRTTGESDGTDLRVFYNTSSGSTVSFDLDIPENVNFLGDFESFGVGNFNGDTKLDFVADSPDTETGVQFLLSEDATYIQDNVTTSSMIHVVETVDVDSDGKTEVAAGREDGRVTVVSYAPAGSSTKTDIPGSFGSPVTSLGTGDLNGDQRVDLVAGSSTDSDTRGQLGIALNSGSGFGTLATLPSPLFVELSQIVVGDVNNDGLADIVGHDASSGGLAILEGNGSGTSFEGGTSLRFVGIPVGRTSVVISDLDGNGENEILVATYNASGYLMTILCLLMLYGLREALVRARRARGTV